MFTLSWTLTKNHHLFFVKSQKIKTLQHAKYCCKGFFWMTTTFPLQTLKTELHDIWPSFFQIRNFIPWKHRCLRLWPSLYKQTQSCWSICTDCWHSQWVNREHVKDRVLIKCRQLPKKTATWRFVNEPSTFGRNRVKWENESLKLPSALSYQAYICIIAVYFNTYWEPCFKESYILFGLDSSSFFPSFSSLFFRIFPSCLAVCKCNNSGITLYRLCTVFQCVCLWDMKLNYWLLKTRPGKFNSR